MEDSALQLPPKHCAFDGCDCHFEEDAALYEHVRQVRKHFQDVEAEQHRQGQEVAGLLRVEASELLIFQISNKVLPPKTIITFSKILIASSSQPLTRRSKCVRHALNQKRVLFSTFRH